MDADWRFHLADAGMLINRISITDWRWKADDLMSSRIAVTDDWRWKADDPEYQADAAKMTSPGLDVFGHDWHNAKSGDDTLKGRSGFYWFRTTLPDIPGPGRTIHFERVSDTAAVYLNGEMLFEHVGWFVPFDVSLDRSWKTDGPNVLAVLVGNHTGSGTESGGIISPVWVGTRVPLISGTPQEPSFDDSAWRTVHIPHDFVIEQPYSEKADNSHGSLPIPTAWYRKTFTLPESDRGKAFWIEFEGIFRDAKIYLNGEKLGEHRSGYIGVRYDISKMVRYGDTNVLAVYVNPRQCEGWFYEGGGIYRHVWLNVANLLHVAPWGTHVTTELSEPQADREPDPATVTIVTTLTNYGSVATCNLRSVLVDETGQVVSSALTPTTVSAGQSQAVRQEITVIHPRLWSLETPSLYQIRQFVEQGPRAIDTAETTFGIRTIRFDKDTGFCLNGKHVKIQGVCNHQDFVGVGIGVPDNLQTWHVKKFKEMGANAWRTAHNPPNPALLDACDRLGMLVMDENRHLGDTYVYNARPWTTATDLSDLASMIQRDRNHPSIIMWSMCNEEPIQGTTEAARLFKAMMDVVHKYDTTRKCPEGGQPDLPPGGAPCCRYAHAR
jgi:beta-galactosidase